MEDAKVIFNKDLVGGRDEKEVLLEVLDKLNPINVAFLLFLNSTTNLKVSVYTTLIQNGVEDDTIHGFYVRKINTFWLKVSEAAINMSEIEKLKINVIVLHELVHATMKLSARRMNWASKKELSGKENTQWEAAEELIAYGATLAVFQEGNEQSKFMESQWEMWCDYEKVIAGLSEFEQKKMHWDIESEMKKVLSIIKKSMRKAA